MKKQLLISFFALLSLVCINAENNRTIRISTDNIDLILQVGENGRLYQTYLGKKLLYERDVRDFPWNVYAASDGSVSNVSRCSGTTERPSRMISFNPFISRLS